jgi:linearmycin/streptolysin S transport system permease protein
MSRTGLIVALAAKDWRLFWADRRSAALCFIVPIVLASTFGMIFHRPTSNHSAAAKLPVLVVIEDDGPFTDLVAVDLVASPRLDARYATRAEAEAAVADGSPSIAIVLPAGFESVKEWRPGRTNARAVIQVLHHPSAEAERQWADGATTEVVMKRLARERLGGLPGGDETTLAAPFRVAASPVGSSTAHVQFNSYSHAFCGMALQYLLFWGMESGLVLARDRRRGVWTRMRAAPVPLWCTLCGRALATALVALLQILATFAFGYLVFGVSVTGSIPGFVLLVAAACGLAASTGLLVAAMSGTEARARSVSILVILAISMVGGLWVPSFLMPGWVRDVALSLPTSWAMRGLCGATWQGQGFIALFPSAAVVAVFAIGFLALAIWRLQAGERSLRRGNT